MRVGNLWVFAALLACGGGGGGTVNPGRATIGDLMGFWQTEPGADLMIGTVDSRVLHVLSAGDFRRIYGFPIPGGDMISDDDGILLDLATFPGGGVLQPVRPEDIAEGRSIRLIRGIGGGRFEIVNPTIFGALVDTWEVRELVRGERLVIDVTQAGRDAPSQSFMFDGLARCPTGLMPSGSALYRVVGNSPPSLYRVAAFDPDGNLRAFASPNDPEPPYLHRGLVEGPDHCPMERDLTLVAGLLEPDDYLIAADGSEHFLQRYTASATQAGVYVRRVEGAPSEVVELPGTTGAAGEVVDLVLDSEGTVRAGYFTGTALLRFVLSRGEPMAEAVPPLPAGNRYEVFMSPRGLFLVRAFVAEGGGTLYVERDGAFEALDLPDDVAFGARVRDDEGRVLVTRNEQPSSLDPRPTPRLTYLERYAGDGSEPERWELSVSERERESFFDTLLAVSPNGEPTIAYSANRMGLALARVEADGSLVHYAEAIDAHWGGGFEFSLGADSPLQVGTPVIVHPKMTFGPGGRVAISDGFQYVLATRRPSDGALGGLEDAVVNVELVGFPEGAEVRFEDRDFRCAAPSCTYNGKVGDRLVLRFTMPAGVVVASPEQGATLEPCQTPDNLDGGVCTLTVEGPTSTLRFEAVPTPFLRAAATGLGPGIQTVALGVVDGEVVSAVGGEITVWELPDGSSVGMGSPGNFEQALGRFVGTEFAWARVLPRARPEALAVLASGDIGVQVRGVTTLDDVRSPAGLGVFTLDADDGSVTNVAGVDSATSILWSAIGPFGGLAVGGVARPGDDFGHTESGVFVRRVSADGAVVFDDVFYAGSPTMDGAFDAEGNVLVAAIDAGSAIGAAGEHLGLFRWNTAGTREFSEAVPCPSSAQLSLGALTFTDGAFVLSLRLPSGGDIGGESYGAGLLLQWIAPDGALRSGALAANAPTTPRPLQEGRFLVGGRVYPEDTAWASESMGVFAAVPLDADGFFAAVLPAGSRYRPFVRTGAALLEVDLTRRERLDELIGR
ncbi:MAG: hypothetical protein AAF938_02620 [Myxococcota bacterium]